MITVDRINNKASAAHLLFLIMESGSDNGNPYGLHPEPPIGIIVIQIPNIPTKKSSLKRTTSRRQPCQRPSFARPEIRQGEQFHTHDSVRRSIRNTTPHLEFIGNSPLHTSGQMSDDNGAERAAVDAAAAFVDATLNDYQDNLVEGYFGGEECDEGNEVGDLGELPPLHNIWDCPYLNKIVRTDDDGKSYAGWTCGWCPPQKDGSTAKPFRGTNATKALSHVVKVSGNDIRPCCGIIPADKARQYNALYLSKAMQKDLRHNKRETMIAGIEDMQDRTVLSLAASSSTSKRRASL